jgi:inner membrane protein COX18
MLVGGQGLGQVQAGTGSGLEVDVSSLATAQETVARYVADQSMTTGGCLWFPDLTAADPLHILPFALSAILVMNVMPKSMLSLRVLLGLDNLPEAAVGGVKWRLRLQRGLLVVAMAVGPITMDLPAALHLYWISSAALTKAQTSIIHKLMPLPRTVPPAKKEQTVLIMPTREDGRKPDGKC